MHVRKAVLAASARATVMALAALLFISGRPVFASGQGTPALTTSARQAVTQAPAQPPAGPVRRVTVDEAVSLALEANLGIQADRLGPQIQDYSVSQARAAWAPNLFVGFNRNSNSSPPESFLSGDAPTITSSAFSNITGVQQQLPWGGGSYDLRWSGSRTETTSFTSFNPLLRSRLDVQFTQPLLRNFPIDGARRQVWQAENLREISDLQLRQSIVTTTRAVRNTYWDLVGAIANLQVAQQSLDLARQSLRDTRTRVEVGTAAPIDIVEAEAEVARNEESVIVNEALIQSAEDRLRALIMNPAQPDFWQTRLEPAQAAELQPQVVDVEGVVQVALDSRTDILQAKKGMENTRIDERFFANQRMPNVDLNLTYGLVGLGGTQLEFGGGFPPPIIGQSQRSFGDVLRDVFGNEYASWALGVTIAYPIGTSSAEAGLAAARLRRTQDETTLRNLELQVATSVRDVARAMSTNLKRVEATQKARELAERRLEAEQKRFSVGLSTSFIIFQVQRDLAIARTNEQRAIIDYNKSLVDLEAVQQAPLGGP